MPIHANICTSTYYSLSFIAETFEGFANKVKTYEHMVGLFGLLQKKRRRRCIESFLISGSMLDFYYIYLNWQSYKHQRHT